MGVLSATGESSFPMGLRVRWRRGWSGEEREGTEAQREGKPVLGEKDVTDS